MTDNQNRRYIDGLRELADFLEERPEFVPIGEKLILVYALGKEEFLKSCRLMGSFDKKVEPNFLNAIKKFNSMLTLELYTNRSNVCERVVTKITVPEQVIPAQKEETIPEHEEEVIEWKCPESWLKDETKPQQEDSS